MFAGGFDDVVWVDVFGVPFPCFKSLLFVDFLWVDGPPFVELVVWLWFYGFGYFVTGGRGCSHQREGGMVMGGRGAVDNVPV